MSFTFCLWIRRGKQESIGTSKVEGELVVSCVWNSNALQEVILFPKCEMLIMWVSFFISLKHLPFIVVHASSFCIFAEIVFQNDSSWCTICNSGRCWTGEFAPERSERCFALWCAPEKQTNSCKMWTQWMLWVATLQTSEDEYPTNLTIAAGYSK